MSPTGDQIGWVAWLMRMAISAVVLAFVVSGSVWYIGDRLLTHALSGFNAALDGTNEAISDVRTEIRTLRTDLQSAKEEALNRFLEAIRDGSKLQVDVTGNFKDLSYEMSRTNERLDNLIVRVDDLSGEFSTLSIAVNTNNALQRELLESMRVK